MRIEELRYALRPENIEGTPREIRFGRRDLARLLLVDRDTGQSQDSYVQDLPTLLSAGDVVVLNNSKRIPGVLKGRTTRGGKVELRFVDFEESGAGLCKVFPTHDVADGSLLVVGDGAVVQVEALGLTKYGLAKVRGRDQDVRALLRSAGEPILGFFYDNAWRTEHLNPYYATEEGSVESPLAGLHFTPELVATLTEAGIHVCFITLHSVGSWLPFIEDDVGDHEMWSEAFHVPEQTAAAVNEARTNGHRVVACGSTSLRALESAVNDRGRLQATRGRTSLYITPGYRFRTVDSYFTNFHQYQTSLIVLDAAFAGRDLVMDSYRLASERGYAFYEFGDAILYQ